MQSNQRIFQTQNLVKMGILGAMAFVLMRALEIPLPFFPSFLKIDFGDLPAVIATLVIHPLAGVIVVVMKNLLALMNSSSGGVGEIANVVIGIGFVLPIGLVTRKNYKLGHILIGSIIGIVLMMIAGVIVNGYITMPLYGEKACIEMGAAINPRIVDKWTFLLYIIAPFNLLKGVLVSLLSIIIVKGMQPILKRLRSRKSSV